MLVSTHGFKPSYVAVRLASLDLGLKERVMLHVQCACFALMVSMYVVLGHLDLGEHVGGF